MYLKLVRMGQGVEEVEKIIPPQVSFLKFLIPGIAAIFLIIVVIGFHRSPSTSPVLSQQPPLIMAPRHVSRPARHRDVSAQQRPSQNLLNSVNTGELESKAEQAFAQGDYQQAGSVWKQILAQDPTNAQARDGLQKLDQMASKAAEESLMTEKAGGG